MSRSTTASAKFDLSVGLASSAARTARRRGSTGGWNTPPTCSIARAWRRWRARLVRLLEAAVAEPERAIGSLDILAPAERDTILREWNDTAHAVAPATLPELFAAQVAKTPDAIAVVFEDER